MRALSLFSGIGGLDLAAEWAGIKTVAFCEYAEFPQKVLKKHWPSIPIFKDIKLLDNKALEMEGIDAKSIELIHAGWPCQPYSVAGKLLGKEDDRDLWPEVFRNVREIRPNWVVGENVANFVNMELDRTISDLESIGYAATAFVLPANAIGAEHTRQRVFVVANSYGQHVSRNIEKQIQEQPSLPGGEYYRSFEDIRTESAIYEPKLSRTYNGIPNQLDRNKSLGNAVVPQQAYPIFQAIAKINSML